MSLHILKLKWFITSQGCYLDECQWLALVQVDSGTYTGDTDSVDDHLPECCSLAIFVQVQPSTWLSAQTGHSSK